MLICVWDYTQNQNQDRVWIGFCFVFYISSTFKHKLSWSERVFCSFELNLEYKAWEHGHYIVERVWPVSLSLEALCLFLLSLNYSVKCLKYFVKWHHAQINADMFTFNIHEL